VMGPGDNHMETVRAEIDRGHDVRGIVSFYRISRAQSRPALQPLNGKR
jgi:hypothetical protein